MNRAYRINDTFEIIGAFWKPITPDDKFTGTLTSNKGRVSLSTAPNYGSAFLSDVDKAMITLRGGPFPRAEGFLGFTQDGESVSGHGQYPPVELRIRRLGSPVPGRVVR